MNVPIIRLEVEGMKHTMLMALAEHTSKIDASVQQAIEEYCTDENINAIVKEEAKAALDNAVKEEVRNFFIRSNAGRQAVREAVIEHLDRMDRLYGEG